MQNQTLSKMDAVEFVRSLDLVGCTLVMEQITGDKPPAHVQNSLISILGALRGRMAQVYGLDIDPRESIGLEQPKQHLTPAELAEDMLRELDEMGG